MTTTQMTLLGHLQRPLPVAFPIAAEVRLSDLHAMSEDQRLLNQVMDDYHATLKRTRRALDYLRTRGLEDPALVKEFWLGFADRSLHERLALRETAEGEAVRAQLRHVGLLRASGHELFRGSLVVPVFDGAGDVVDGYGRKVTPNLRSGTPDHVALHTTPRGVFNAKALSAETEVILCKGVLDALTFWKAGFGNVTATLGLMGFTAEHLSAFAANRTRRVFVAFDRTAAGDRAARLVAQALETVDIECRRVRFPRGFDANDYALATGMPERVLGEALRKARPCRQTYGHLRKEG